MLWHKQETRTIERHHGTLAIKKVGSFSFQRANYSSSKRYTLM